MDRAAAEAFLAEPRILVLATDPGAGDAKVTLARRNPAVTLCVQDERRP